MPDREERGKQLVEHKSFFSILGRTGDLRTETAQTGVGRYLISSVIHLSSGM